jgi:tetratricopeptide (TPR) repeat protein
MWRFWQMRGYLQEGLDRVVAILALPGSRDDPVARRRGLDAAAGLAYWRGDMDGARPFYEEALELARASGDKAAIAEALYNESFVFMVTLTDIPRGKALAEEALQLFREVGEPSGIARALWDVGNSEYYLANYDAACKVLLESVAIWRKVGDQFGLGWAVHTLGLCLLRLGDLEGARQAWVEMLEIFRSADDVSGIGTALSNFRSLAVERGDAERALRLGGASNAVVLRTGVDLASVITEIEGRADRERGMIDEAHAAQAWAEGAAMPLADAIAYALAGERDADTHAARPLQVAR